MSFAWLTDKHTTRLCRGSALVAVFVAERATGYRRERRLLVFGNLLLLRFANQCREEVVDIPAVVTLHKTQVNAKHATASFDMVELCGFNGGRGCLAGL
jgi:hypothetical protein